VRVCIQDGLPQSAGAAVSDGRNRVGGPRRWMAQGQEPAAIKRKTKVTRRAANRAIGFHLESTAISMLEHFQRQISRAPQTVLAIKLSNTWNTFLSRKIIEFFIDFAC
jgi:hypothetical protein